ncbi:MAG TPA: COX15/CtaA family protein [Burkholderiales bacterium]|jgi:cytochrome c oxidase assembly protein subunit 15|nr:COX15/CtaA family protein [Burkholderiales bacterium]
MSRAYRLLAGVTLGLAFIVVVVGAYVRLSDAGLGCPDWPFCYGQPVPSDIADGDALAKAWKEMGHRYLAGTLGALILILAFWSWKARRSRWLASSILALVLFQATLGAWTVTMLLKPAIVTAHLLGGMTILGALTWLAVSQLDPPPLALAHRLRIPAAIALAVLAVQIALGGWVSSNYAALACPDVPLCLGRALPPMDFGNAFHVLRELGQTPQGELLSREALTAIHWSHRMFALIAVAVIGWAAYRAMRVSKTMTAVVAGLLIVQFSIGVANVIVSRPLALAAAHNAGAAGLLAALVVLNFFAFRATGATHPGSR